MPAATSMASCPAPLIWKKIRLWFLSWISLSSIRRESSISAVGVEEIVTRQAVRGSRLPLDVFVLLPLLTAVAFIACGPLSTASNDWPGAVVTPLETRRIPNRARPNAEL